VELQWVFHDDGTIRNQGMCMDLPNGSTRDGAVVQVVYCTGSPDQQFRRDGNGLIVSALTGDKCVDLRDPDDGIKFKVRLFPCQGDDSQVWGVNA
jgi:streptogrisin C